ncbi:MAG: DUF2219 family protein [Gammaproteobacteria bacterium]|nr:DUF2219 family protein [Gammaproteobacteria bacterium]
MTEKPFFNYRNILFFINIIPLLAWSLFCYGADTQRYISVISENDIYAPKAQDRHYSNGLRVGFNVINNRLLPEKLRFFLDEELTSSYRDEIAIGHNIYTPENYLSSELQVNDRPFAGWLYGDYTAIVNTNNIETA